VVLVRRDDQGRREHPVHLLEVVDVVVLAGPKAITSAGHTAFPAL